MDRVTAAAAEAHHRIANSLALLAGLVRLQASRADGRAPPGQPPPDLRYLLDGIAARLAAVGRLHRLLSRMPQEGRLPLRPYLRDICEDMVTAFSSPEQTLDILHTGGDCALDVQHVQDVALILCEILINALKHARPSGGPLTIRVDCAAQGEGRARLTVSDDGRGLPDGFDLSRQGGLGLKVIRSLAAGMDAPLEIDSSAAGLTFRLTLPAASG